jgi:stearoyl-CoA desaturase (delta-9 desaturase)
MAAPSIHHPSRVALASAARALSIAPAAPATGAPKTGIHWFQSLPFFLVHVTAVIGLAWVGFSWKGVAWALGLYLVRMFGVTAGYHRYFSHRTYKTSRVFQFLLGLLAVTSMQKGVLWWAAHHRHHHKFSDQENDVHSMKLRGFWWSHVGWVLSREHEDTDLRKVSDLAKFAELRWLERLHVVPGIVLAVALFFIDGTRGLFYGFFASTVLLWHGTFTINSLSHWLGRRRFATSDESRNSWLLAIITLGEGWHNNHHFYQRSTRQGFYWWEYDVTFYVLKVLSWFRIVWDLHAPPAALLERAKLQARHQAGARKEATEEMLCHAAE